MAEIAVIRLCRPAMERNMDTVFAPDRSRWSGSWRRAIVVQPRTAPAAQSREAGGGGKTPGEDRCWTEAIPEDIEQVVADWKGIIRDLSGMTKNYLRHARLSLGGENRLLDRV